MSNILKKRRFRSGWANVPDARADDVLCYMDQGSFLGLRALGRGPVLQLTWLYPHPIDEGAVTALSERLAKGFLGRLLQRSPLPWGRHRWVTDPASGPVTWCSDPLPRERLRRELLDLIVDPERGPGWRLAVQALEGGGCALTLLASHTIADMQAVSNAVANAVAGRPFDDRFPARSWRWSPLMVGRDSVESLRSLPAVWRAMRALAQRARARDASAPPPRNNRKRCGPVVDIPLLHIDVDAEACQNRASAIGITSNTLIAAFVARLAFRLGRVDESGRVKLVLPVSDRRSGDRRGNALQSITVMADPDACWTDPRALQRDLKAALASLIRNGDEFSSLYPLIPYVPLWLARRLETEAVGQDLPVGCSLIGHLSPDLQRPCGEALLLEASLLERYTVSDLERLGGVLFVASYHIEHRLSCTVSAYIPNRITSRKELMPPVRDALADVGLGGLIN